MEDRMDHIISRLLSGNASTDDLLKASEWLHADKKNQEEFRKLKDYWDAEVSFNHSILPALAYEKSRAQITRTQLKRRGLQIVSGAAAILLLLIVSTLFLPKNPSPEHFYTYISNDRKTEVRLEDGTKVLLNKNSRLTYSDAFGKEERQVQLVGEAFFEVAKDTAKAFNVQIDDASIRVLGTTFQVKARPDEDFITATLLEGSICFKSPDQQVVLLPNQQLRFGKLTRQLDILTVDVYDETAWKDDLLKYKSIPFVSLLKNLEPVYHVKFVVLNKQLADPSVTVSGTFTQGQSLEQILQVIHKSLPIRWNYKNGTYYIK